MKLINFNFPVPNKETRERLLSNSISAATDSLLIRFLVDEVKDVRRIDEDGGRTSNGDSEEEIQLESVDDHRYVPPVFQHLKKTSVLEAPEIPNL